MLRLRNGIALQGDAPSAQAVLTNLTAFLHSLKATAEQLRRMRSDYKRFSPVLSPNSYWQ